MSFIHQQFNSFLNLGICKEYSIMARVKSTTGSKQKDAVIPSGIPAAAATTAVDAGSTQAETNRAEVRKLEIVKPDSRANVVPMNLEDEIRRRAYELAKQRGFEGGSATEDWLTAEREVLQRYRQQSA
jgi:hypothetical protein